MTVTIPDELNHWQVNSYPDGDDGLLYHCAISSVIMGHTVDVIGLGETAQQAVDEALRARRDLERRT